MLLNGNNICLLVPGGAPSQNDESTAAAKLDDDVVPTLKE